MIDFSKRVTEAELTTKLAKKADNNAELLSAFKTSFGNIDLATSAYSAFSAFITWANAKKAQGNYDFLAPFHGVMVRVSVDSTSATPLRWDYGGDEYSLSSSGLKMATFSGWRDLSDD